MHALVEIPVGGLHDYVELTWNDPGIFYDRKTNDNFFCAITKIF